MNLLLNIVIICFLIVVVVTVDGVYVAYDESDDSVIGITVNGVDAAMQESSGVTGQVIIISLRYFLGIVDNGGRIDA